MIYAVDCETTGKEPYLGSRAFLITWCAEDGTTGFCRIGMDDMLPISFILTDPGNEIVCHNFGFDLAFLRKLGLNITCPMHDTLIAAHLHNPLEPSKRLKDLAKKYLKRENLEEERLDKWFWDNGMRADEKREYIKVPEDIILPYALADAAMTMELWQFYKKLGVTNTPVYKFECSLIQDCADIVQEGMKVDRAFAKEAAARTSSRVIELVTEAKLRFNVDKLGSNDQIADVLFAQGGLVCAPEDKTKTGAPCLDEDTIRKYDHPIVPLVIEYRETVKMNSTYLQPMLIKTDKEDRIHASLNQTGARTGRMSSSNPNLENIPRNGGCVDIRRGFVTKGPDYSLLFIDLSQIELRVLAHYTQEPAMVRALSTRDGDLHAATAELIFGSAEKKYRTIAKTLNFATIYGAGAERIQLTLRKEVPDMKITVEQAKQFKAEYFQRFPEVRKFMWKVEGLVRERAVTNPDAVGYVTGLSGRKYLCPASASYRILNYLVQGEAAMFFKSKLLALRPVLEGKKTRRTNVVHDEFIFDLYNEERQLVPELINTIEDFTTFRVPIFANAAISETNWAEKHSI